MTETRTSEDDMSIIKKQDFIDSVADALQYISYYHPLDFVHAAKAAYDREVNPAAKDALAQIPDQLPHVSRRASSPVPGYRYRYLLRQDRHAGAVGQRYDGAGDGG